MKKTLFLSVIFLCVFISATSAIIVQFFSNWETLTKESQDIAIVKCVETPQPLLNTKNGATVEIKDDIIESKIEIVSTLKGNLNNLKIALYSELWPRQSEEYLVFGKFHDGFFQANEQYRVIPLDMDFPTNILNGKSLDEKIQTVLKYRLDKLNRQIKAEQEEKARLEAGLKK